MHVGALVNWDYRDGRMGHATMDGMNWDDLRFLLAIGREGTLTGAARELGVNHSTVSRRLQAVEENLGTRLFDRLPQGYEPTPAGRGVLDIAEEVETRVHRIDRELVGADARLSGTLRVTTLDVINERYMGDIAEFAKRYPGVDLELCLDDMPRSLARREADVALRMSNAPAEHLVGRRLAHAEFGLYGSRALVEAHAGQDGFDGDDFGQLQALPWLAWAERMGARLTEAWMDTHVPDANVALRVDSSNAMISAIRHGLGVQFIACFLGDAEPDLVRLRPPEPGFGMDLWVLTHADLRGTARVKAFMDHISQAVRRDADLLAGARPQPGLT